ncbi:MAG: acyloxyacyl hydrolase [Deltaproteobacteria bacterium]|nr:acyloxyacyl hydrolase [Deltaproteobacteria bacterium]
MMRFGTVLRDAFILLIVLTILVVADRADAEVGQTWPAVSESGVVIGYGEGNIREGTYRQMLMIWHVGFNLKEFSSGRSDGRKNTLSWYLEPQINPSFSPRTDVEFGVGVGLKYMHHITDRLSAYVMASVGPHWMTLQTDDQANGFIFSDMVGVGLAIFVTDNSSLNLEFRQRHLSNGGLASPNLGINSSFGAVGYSVFF